MKDKRWKKLEPETGITSQEEWDALDDIRKELRIQNDRFVKRRKLHEENDRRFDAECGHNSIYWGLKGRERYEYWAANGINYRLDSVTAQYSECLEQARADFEKDKTVREKYGCPENIFLEKTFPMAVSRCAGLLNGLIMDIRVMEKGWQFGTSAFGFTEDMNWFDKLECSCHKLYYYWHDNVQNLYLKEDFKETYIRNMKEVFKDVEDAAVGDVPVVGNFKNDDLSAVRLEGRLNVILFLSCAFMFYRKFLRDSGIRDFIGDFLKNEKLLGVDTYPGFGIVAFHDFKEFDLLKEHGHAPGLSPGKISPDLAVGLTFYEDIFLNSYGLHEKDPDFMTQAEAKCGERLIHQHYYSWTLYPMFIPVANYGITLDDLLPYYDASEGERFVRFVEKNGETDSYYVKNGKKIWYSKTAAEYSKELKRINRI